MKKKIFMVILLIIIFLKLDVYAKDDVYTLNKYDEEEYNYILKDKNSFITAGIYLKEVIKDDNNTHDDTQVMLVKYDKNHNILWKYGYGSTIRDDLYSLNYYNSNDISGYLLTVNKTANYDTYDFVVRPYFVVIDKNGKNVKEVEANIDGYTVNYVINTANDEGIIDGYLVVGENSTSSIIAKYDLELNQLWTNTFILDGYTSSFIKEIGEYKNSYIGIIYTSNNKYALVKFNKDGTFNKIIKDDFEESDQPHILVNKDNYLLYGFTSEVKINNNASTSYYIFNYNELDEVVWDIIGDTSVNKDNTIKLRDSIKNNNIIGYNMMYFNGNDNSIEVVNINSDGTIGNKIKKIKNSYYKVNDYYVDKSTIYFIGQINCPEDDNCEYDASCLLLVSDENKVIEVNDNDSRNIIIVVSIIIVGIYFIVFYVKKRRNSL